MSKGAKHSSIKLPPTEQLFDDWYQTLNSPILPNNEVPNQTNEITYRLPTMRPAASEPQPPFPLTPHDPLPLTISSHASPTDIAAHTAHLTALRLTNELHPPASPRPSGPEMERRKTHLAKRKVLKKGQLQKEPLQKGPLQKEPLQKGIKIPWNPDLVKQKQGKDGDGDNVSSMIEGYGAEYESSSDDNLTFEDPVLAKKSVVEEGAKGNEAPMSKRKTQPGVKQRIKTPMDEGKGTVPANIDRPSVPIKKHGVKTGSTPPKANKLETAQPVPSDPVPFAQEPKATPPRPQPISKPTSRSGTPSPPQQRGSPGPGLQAPRELSKSRRLETARTLQYTSLPVPAPTQLRSRSIPRPSIQPRKPSRRDDSTPEVKKTNMRVEKSERYKRDWPIRFQRVIEVGAGTAGRGEHVAIPVIREDSPIIAPHESMPDIREGSPVPTEQGIPLTIPNPTPAPAASAIMPVQVIYSQTPVVVRNTARPARPATRPTVASTARSGIKKPKSHSQTKSKTKAKRNRRTSLQMLLEAAGPNHRLNLRLRPH